jgi:hypothetical protein
MKFELTLYVVLVFLVPGFVGTSSIGLWNGSVLTLLKNTVQAPTTGNAVLLLGLTFAIGALVDSLRSLFVDPLLDKRISEKLNSQWVKKLCKDNIEIFRFLTERTQEYYRLNANTAVVSTAFTVSYVIRYPFGAVSVILISLTVLFWLTARKSRRDTIIVTNLFAGD